MMELELIRDIGLIVVLWIIVVAAIVAIYVALRDPHEYVRRIKREYEERISELKKQLETMEQLLKAKEIEHREELAKIAKAGRMLRELDKAVKAGAVKIVCPVHKAEATILADGTIICERGHRLWPKEAAVEEETIVKPVVEWGKEDGEGSQE